MVSRLVRQAHESMRMDTDSLCPQRPGFQRREDRAETSYWTAQTRLLFSELTLLLEPLLYRGPAVCKARVRPREVVDLATDRSVCCSVHRTGFRSSFSGVHHVRSGPSITDGCIA